MVKSLGKKIAVTALSLFLAGKSVQALTPENLSEVKTAFRADNSSFLILQDNSITSVGTKKDRIVFDEKKKQWISNDGKVMSSKFQEEAEKVLKFANDKAKKGIKFVDFFEYNNNTMNLWGNKEASFGSYSISILNENTWYQDKNGNLKSDKGEYMLGAFNTLVNKKIVADLSELVTLRERQADSEKEKAEYEKRIANLNSTIADYMDKSVPTNDLKVTITEYTDKIKELTAENARLESEYAGKLKTLEETYKKGLEGAVTGSNNAKSKFDAWGFPLPETQTKENAVAVAETKVDAEEPQVKPYALPSGIPLIIDSIEGLGANSSLTEDIRDENKIAREYAKQHPITNTNTVPLTNANETTEIPTNLSIILQPVSDIHFAQKGASVGMRYDFGMFGVGLLGNVEFSPDAVVETYVGEVGKTGRHAEGETTEKQKLSLGLDLEGKVGFFVAGAGVNYNQGVIQSDERIMKGTNPLSSNTSSVPYNNLSYSAYAGAEFQVSSGFSLGAVAGYDGNSGFFGGVRGTVKVQLPSISVSSVKQEVQPSASNVQKDSKEIGRN